MRGNPAAGNRYGPECVGWQTVGQNGNAVHKAIPILQAQQQEIRPHGRIGEQSYQ